MIRDGHLRVQSPLVNVKYPHLLVAPVLMLPRSTACIGHRGNYVQCPRDGLWMRNCVIHRTQLFYDCGSPTPELAWFFQTLGLGLGGYRRNGTPGWNPRFRAERRRRTPRQPAVVEVVGGQWKRRDRVCDGPLQRDLVSNLSSTVCAPVILR